MIIKMTIEHTIQPGEERQALELVKELNRRNPLHSMRPGESRVKSVEGDSEVDDGTVYLDHLESFSRLNRLSRAPAKIRIYLTPCA